MGLICISACWASLWRLHLARYQPLNSSVTKNYSETALSTWRACKVHEPNDHFVTRSKRPIFCYPFCYPPSWVAVFCGFWGVFVRLITWRSQVQILPPQPKTIKYSYLKPPGRYYVLGASALWASSLVTFWWAVVRFSTWIPRMNAHIFSPKCYEKHTATLLLWCVFEFLFSL